MQYYCCAFPKWFLARITQGEFTTPLEFGHSTVAHYPKINVPHPLPWFMLKYGTAQIGA